MRELLDGLPRLHPHVVTSNRTTQPYQNIRKVFERALKRAGITSDDGTVHRATERKRSSLEIFGRVLVEAAAREHTVSTGRLSRARYPPKLQKS